MPLQNKYIFNLEINTDFLQYTIESHTICTFILPKLLRYLACLRVVLYSLRDIYNKFRLRLPCPKIYRPRLS